MTSAQAMGGPAAAAALQHFDMYIGGQWRGAQSGERFETVNPFTGRAWATVPRRSPAWPSSSP